MGHILWQLIKRMRFIIIIDHTMGNDSQKARTTTSIAVIAIIAIVALLGVVALTVAVIIPLQQEAEARGCPLATPAINASKTRCFHP
jgi:hypothetical protein